MGSKSNGACGLAMALAAVGMSWAGCLGESGDGIALVEVEENDLGITHVTIEHTDRDPDRLLVIRGLDERDEEIASATLRTGMVFYPPGRPEMATWNRGTELELAVGAATDGSTSPDLGGLGSAERELAFRMDDDDRGPAAADVSGPRTRAH